MRHKFRISEFCWSCLKPLLMVLTSSPSPCCCQKDMRAKPENFLTKLCFLSLSPIIRRFSLILGHFFSFMLLVVFLNFLSPSFSNIQASELCSGPGEHPHLKLTYQIVGLVCPHPKHRVITTYTHWWSPEEASWHINNLFFLGHFKRESHLEIGCEFDSSMPYCHILMQSTLHKPGTDVVSLYILHIYKCLWRVVILWSR